MRLIDLLEGDSRAVTHGSDIDEVEITGMTCDSREVDSGFLFAALPGVRRDGRDFIPEALARGAAAVMAPPGTRLPDEASRVPLLVDDNLRRLFALTAARFFERQPRTIAAVTGTNGKTSVVSFLRQMWTRLGHAAASLGTLGLNGPGIRVAGSLTTPDPVTLHKRLRDLADGGVECLAMEASSHGLAQCRLDGVRVSIGAFTNISRDHLDYHGTMEAYLGAKLRLFDEVMQPGGTAVLNADVREFETLREVCRERGHRVLSYGEHGVDVRLDAADPAAGGQRLHLTVLGRPLSVMLPLAGTFQAANALCALAVMVAGGEHPDAAVAALDALEGAPGRLQWVGRTAGGAAVYVDYAHTPDALATVLSALRPHAEGRLWVVFGCGGDRDPGKRPQMGRIAADLADTVVVTDDNPRSEDPAAIRARILADCPGAVEIGDRAAAIAHAVDGLAPGDVLVVAGKGHETGQIVGEAVVPFDDAEVVRQALRALAGKGEG